MGVGRQDLVVEERLVPGRVGLIDAVPDQVPSLGNEDLLVHPTYEPVDRRAASILQADVGELVDEEWSFHVLQRVHGGSPGRGPLEHEGASESVRPHRWRLHVRHDRIWADHGAEIRGLILERGVVLCRRDTDRARLDSQDLLELLHRHDRVPRRMHPTTGQHSRMTLHTVQNERVHHDHVRHVARLREHLEARDLHVLDGIRGEGEVVVPLGRSEQRDALRHDRGVPQGLLDRDHLHVGVHAVEARVHLLLLVLEDLVGLHPLGFREDALDRVVHGGVGEVRVHLELNILDATTLADAEVVLAEHLTLIDLADQVGALRHDLGRQDRRPQVALQVRAEAHRVVRQGDVDVELTGKKRHRLPQKMKDPDGNVPIGVSGCVSVSPFRDSVGGLRLALDLDGEDLQDGRVRDVGRAPLRGDDDRVRDRGVERHRSSGPGHLDVASGRDGLTGADPAESDRLEDPSGTDCADRHVEIEGPDVAASVRDVDGGRRPDQSPCGRVETGPNLQGVVRGCRRCRDAGLDLEPSPGLIESPRRDRDALVERGLCGGVRDDAEAVGVIEELDAPTEPE